ncbi:MAG: hypothetical protein Q9191_003586 [Dirinaria sp. TL-2023a]
MTSNTSGNQWLRTANPAFAKPVNTAVFPFYQQTPRSFPRENLYESATLAATPSKASQPAVKRQRLNDGSLNTGSGLPRQPSAHASVQKANSSVNNVSPKHSEDSMQSQGSLAHGNDKARRKGSKSPILPMRPGKRPQGRLSSSEALSTTDRAASRGQVSTKPYVAESPSLAPRLKHSGSADFHPWTGHHPEDILNETTMTSGSYDKLRPSQNESASAKPTLLPSLKHKSGLQILSSLFVSVLDQRQSHGIVSASCTFKPPPRVTLTDTKREIWLRDLANPDIPLRRLSRTIPHGIRGKVLLDQCLEKKVPIPRAVWLAKCVGANEIRAFKRKGAGGAFAIGGESKWIKDWTSNVEQFIEHIISSCGSSDWRTHIDYGLRFTTHLISEHLLDQEHYLSWILTSLQDTDLENLPMWLLIMQLQFDELTGQRRRGKCLAKALLEQLRKASETQNPEVYGPVIQALMRVLISMITSAPDCFFLPRVWGKYETTMRLGLGEADADILACFERISERNTRFMSASREDTWERLNTPRKRLVHLLDTMPVDGNFVKLSKECLKTTDDFDLLVATCFEWSASIHRNGEARIYMIARLLRQCSALQAGLDESIMRFLGSMPTLPGLSVAAVYRVVAELLRSKHLSAGRFLSWLMARGRLHERMGSNQGAPVDAQYLSEMPIQGMPLHILNLRRILLSKIGVSTKDEDHAVASLKAEIARKIPGFFSPPETSSTFSTHSLHPAEFSIAIKFTVTSSVRQAVAAQFGSGKPKETKETASANPEVGNTNIAEHVPCTSITLNQFLEIRNILEDFGDFAILADVLNIVSESEDVSVLTAVCNTVSYHFGIFAAIGAHNSLFRNLMQQYDSIRNSKPVDQSFVDSLIDLGKCIPAAAKDTTRLRQQALLYQQASSIIACSPISDTMVEASQCAESSLGDDLEQILATSTSIDKRMLTKLFTSITTRLETSWSEPTQPPAVFIELLGRLRRYGRATFDGLMHDWIGRVLQDFTGFTPVKTLLPLICAGCLALSGLLDTTTKALKSLTAADRRIILATNVIGLLASISADKALRAVARGYRPRLQYERTLRRRPGLVAPCLQTVFDTHSIGAKRARPHHTSDHRQELRNLVNDLAVYNLPVFNELSRSLGASELWDELSPIISDRDSSSGSLRHELALLLATVNDFNMPFCQARLQALLSESTNNETDPIGALHSVMVEEVSMCKQASKSLWPALVSGLVADQSSVVIKSSRSEVVVELIWLQLRHYAENEILAGILCEGKALTSDSKELAETLLSIVEATTIGPLDTAAFPIGEITEKLNGVLPSQYSSRELINEVDGAIPLHEETFSVHVLLRLLAVQQCTPQRPEFSQPALYELVISLSLLSTSPFFRDRASLAAYTIDLIALFSDSLSEETRGRCVRTLRDHHHVSDPQLYFVVGHPDDVYDQWLQLSTGTSIGSGAKASENAPTSITTPQSFPLRRWEMMQDATPVMGENDTSLSLTLFGARKSCL